MNPFTFAVLAAAAAFSLQRAHAADLPVNYNHVEYKQTGNTYRWTPLHGPTPSSGAGVVFRGPTGIDTVQPKISTMARLPFDKRGDVPVSQMAKVTSPFTKKAFGVALMVAGKLAWPVGVIITAGEIFDYFNGFGVSELENTGGEIRGKVIRLNELWSPPYGTGKFGSAFDACYARYGQAVASAYIFNSGSSAYCKTSAGGSIATVQRDSVSNTVHLVHQQDLEEMIAQESGWPTTAARALQSALNTPGVTIETEPPLVSGPSSIPGPTTTTTTQTQVAPGTTTPVAPGTPGAQPATVTTKTTTTTNNVYNNNQVTNNTKTTTTTNITNNITNQTTENTDKEEVKEETKEDDSEDETPSDTPLGDIPKLYERKYPDGLTGIWNAKSVEIKQAPLFTLADQLMPTGLTSGTCPSWRVDLGFGGGFGEYGLQDVSPPCWIWDIAKVIIIASALILARALVFGG